MNNLSAQRAQRRGLQSGQNNYVYTHTHTHTSLLNKLQVVQQRRVTVAWRLEAAAQGGSCLCCCCCRATFLQSSCDLCLLWLWLRSALLSPPVLIAACQQKQGEKEREGERGNGQGSSPSSNQKQNETDEKQKQKQKKETSERAVIFAALQIDKSSNAGIEVSEGWARSLQRKMGWIKVK